MSLSSSKNRVTRESGTSTLVWATLTRNGVRAEIVQAVSVPVSPIALGPTGSGGFAWAEPEVGQIYSFAHHQSQRENVALSHRTNPFFSLLPIYPLLPVEKNNALHQGVTSSPAGFSTVLRIWPAFKHTSMLWMRTLERTRTAWFQESRSTPRSPVKYPLSRGSTTQTYDSVPGLKQVIESGSAPVLLNDNWFMCTTLEHWCTQ